MFTNKKENVKATNTTTTISSPTPVEQKKDDDDDHELDRLARQMLLEEAKRNKIRAQTHGALGWQKPTHSTNRKFLSNTLISNAVHNTHRNYQQQYTRNSNRFSSRREDDHSRRRKRSRTPSPRRRKYDDDSPTSKRTKKDK